MDFPVWLAVYIALTIIGIGLTAYYYYVRPDPNVGFFGAMAFGFGLLRVGMHWKAIKVLI